MANYIIGGIVIALFALATWKTIKDKKNNTCGCGCSGCGSSKTCHDTKTIKK